MFQARYYKDFAPTERAWPLYKCPNTSEESLATPGRCQQRPSSG